MLKDTFNKSLWKDSLKSLYLKGIIKKYDEIRISFSQLYRLKIGSQYFFVKHKRFSKFQSLASTYDYSNDFKNLYFKKLNIRSENIYTDKPNHFKVFIYAKNLIKFLRIIQKSYD